MFGAYIDESFDDGNLGFFAVAAVLGDGWGMLKAETKWKGLLQKLGQSVFKASAWTRRPDVIVEFVGVIASSDLIFAGIVVDQIKFKKHFSNSGLHKQFKNSPYLLCYHQMFVGLAMSLAKHNSRHVVSFVCDENARYRNSLQRSYSQLKLISPVSAPYMGSCSFDTDEKCIPLQMADLIGSELRRAGDAWTPDAPTVSQALRILVNSEKLFRVDALGDRYLQSVRNLVDRKAELANRA